MFDPKLAIGFAAIVEHGSITAGAHSLGVAQPWMSEQLRKLEDLVGAPLLVRTSRRLDLTAAGKRFLPYAQKLAATALDAERFVATERSSANALLRIGATHFTFGTPERTSLIEAYLGRHPAAMVEIHPGAAGDLTSALCEGALDLAMVHLNGVVDRTDLETVQIIERYAHLYLVIDDPLANRSMVALEELAGRELVVSPGRDDPESMRRSLSLLTDVGVRLVAAPDADRTSVHAFAAHLRSACLWWHAERRPYGACGDRWIVPIEGYPITSPIALVRRRGDHRRPVAWMWRVAQEMEDGIAAAKLAPPPVHQDGG